MREALFFAAGVSLVIAGAQHDTWAEITAGVLMMLAVLW